MAAPKRSRKKAAEDERRFAIKVDSAGRVLIPAELRKEYGIKPGTVVIVHPGGKGERMILRTRDAVIREAQAYFKSLRPAAELWSEELIRERHAEARREYGE